MHKSKDGSHTSSYPSTPTGNSNIIHMGYQSLPSSLLYPPPPFPTDSPLSSGTHFPTTTLIPPTPSLLLLKHAVSWAIRACDGHKTVTAATTAAVPIGLGCLLCNNEFHVILRFHTKSFENKTKPNFFCNTLEIRKLYMAIFIQ